MPLRNKILEIVDGNSGGVKTPVNPDYDIFTSNLLFGPLRDEAYKLGYAIAVHGSLSRDIDLIACPWTDKAVDAKSLIHAIKAVVAPLIAPCICRRLKHIFRRGVQD